MFKLILRSFQRNINKGHPILNNKNNIDTIIRLSRSISTRKMSIGNIIHSPRSKKIAQATERTFQMECPFLIRVRVTQDGQKLFVKDLCGEHNHEVSGMTGLDVMNDRILEIACLVTEGNLTIVAEGPNLVIHQDDSVLDKMGEWCVQHHGESGLTEAVKKSKISTKEAEAMVLNFLQEHTPKGKCPLAGNSVGMDKRFLDEYMPRLAQHLHYRIVDVSTVKELCRRWYPSDYNNSPAKKLSHRSMDDIKESIDELKFYRSTIFK